MKRIAVLLPCYNESLSIKKVIEDFRRVLPEADIYVYDNNSTDGTDQIAKEAGAIVRYEKRQGKGNVVRAMFHDIDADCYIMADGDDTYPAEYAREMADLVLCESYDMVIGDRLSSTYFTENKRPFHNFGNVLVRKAINRLFKSDVTDIMTGYRAFSRSFIKMFPVISRGFEIETEMTIHALYNNALITSVPVDYRDRQEGSESKLDTMRDGVRVLGKIFDMYREYKPMQFFSGFALVFLLLGILLLVPVLRDYVQTGLVPRFPSLIAAGIFGVVALLSFFVGVIIDIVAKKHRKLFELLNNMGWRDADKR